MLRGTTSRWIEWLQRKKRPPLRKKKLPADITQGKMIKYSSYHNKEEGQGTMVSGQRQKVRVSLAEREKKEF